MMTKRGIETQKAGGADGWRVRIGLVVLSLLLGGVLAEGAVRLADPLLAPYEAIHFASDPKAPVLFMRDAWLQWKLRPAVRLFFTGVTVRTDRNGFRGEEIQRDRPIVLCLGDSITFGWGVEEGDSYPAQLARILRERGLGNWQFVNAGVPGYSSEQVLLQAARILPKLKPRVVILSVGTNESWPVPRGEREVLRSRRFAAPVEELISHSHFWLWLRDLLAPQRPEQYLMPDLARAVPRVRVEEFSENVRAVMALARREGAAIVLLEPTVNRRVAPIGDIPIPGEEEGRKRALQLVERIPQDGVEAVVAASERRLETSPGDSFALWVKGTALSRRSAAEGLPFLEAAYERHPYPVVAKPSLRLHLESIAQRAGVPYVRTNDLLSPLEAAAPGTFFLDHCHPTPAGHRIVAETLAAVIGSILAESRRAGF